MKAVALSVPLVLGGLSGCGDDGGPPPEPPGPAVTITITSDKAPALVAVRDGDAAWQAATMRTPTSFEAEVHGPYVVTVVCADLALGQLTTFQLARTPDDARDLMQRCNFTSAPRYAVTGHMVQAGRVQLENAVRTSTTTDWDFGLQVHSGAHDLLATTADRLVLRHGIAVNGATAVAPIDVVQEGALLADVAFTVTNATPAETLVASVHLDKPSPTTPLGVYRGPIAPAKVAPDSVLTAADAQSASMQATAGSSSRALRRPFRVGGNTVYTLPAALGDVQWEIANGDLAVSWSSVPPFGSFSLTADGSSGPTRFQGYSLDLSPGFFDATGATRATIDTDIPGYQPEWRIDFTRPYNRQLFVQRVADGEIATSWVSEQITAVAPLAGASLAAAAPSLPPAGAGLAEP